MAFNVVEWAGVNLSALIPIKIIRSYERGVEYRKGIVGRQQLDPGWYWKWPWFREIEDVPVNLQWIDLPFQRLVTADGKTVTCSYNLGFEIYDAVIWHNDVQDAEETLINLARPVIVDVVTGYEYETLTSRITAMSRLVRAHLNGEVGYLGGKLVGGGFTDFTEAHAYTFMSDGNEVNNIIRAN